MEPGGAPGRGGAGDGAGFEAEGTGPGGSGDPGGGAGVGAGLGVPRGRPVAVLTRAVPAGADLPEQAGDPAVSARAEGGLREGGCPGAGGGAARAARGRAEPFPCPRGAGGAVRRSLGAAAPGTGPGYSGAARGTRGRAAGPGPRPPGPVPVLAPRCPRPGGCPVLLPHRAALVLASSSAYKRFSELLPKEQRDNACSLRVPKSRILTLPELRVRSLAAAGPHAAPWGAASGQGSAHPSGPPWCPRSVLAVLL